MLTRVSCVRQIFELNGLVGRKHARGQDSSDTLEHRHLSKDTVTNVSSTSWGTALIPNPTDATPQPCELDKTSDTIRSEQSPPQNSIVCMADAALPAATGQVLATPKVLATARPGLRDMTNSVSRAAFTNRFPLPKAESPSKRVSTPAHPGPLKTPARFAETSSHIKARGVGDRFASRTTLNSSRPACLAGAVNAFGC